MPIPQHERESYLDGLRTYLKKFDTGVEVFVQPQLGADFNFSEIDYLFRDVLETAKQVREGPHEKLPLRMLQVGFQAFDELNQPLQRIVNFSVADIAKQGKNPVDVRTELIDNFEKAASVFLDRMAAVLAFMGTRAEEAVPSTIGEAALEQLTLVKQVFADSEALKRELETVVAASREAAGKVGVSQHAVHFAEEARRHAKESLVWLVDTVILSGVTLAAAAYNYGFLATAEVASDRGQVIQLVVAKLVLFSLLVTATVWCGKNYRSTKHNLVVNRHRQNALSSFQAFAEATSDDQTRNAVLLQATQSIFTPQHSGYVSTESEAGGSAQIIELVRNVTGKSD